MRSFDHIGIPSPEPHENERYVAATKVWVTDPHLHPFSVEWLRFEEDSPSPAVTKHNPHIAFKVDDIAKESAGMREILAPFRSVAGHVVGFYQTDDGAIVELMMFTE